VSEVLSLLVDPINHPDVFAEDLSRAKNQLKTSMFMNLEHRTILYDDIARQVSIYGFRYSPAELSTMIDEVSNDDIIRVMLGILSSNPTVVALAPPKELKKMLDYDSIKNYIRTVVDDNSHLKKSLFKKKHSKS